MSKEIVLRIAVVGHTNTGKTSLLRTLARDTAFGEVADTPATTRQVEGIALLVEGEPGVELFDTPGLEAAPELYETLQAMDGPRHTGPERVARLLARPDARFEQEARVLDQVMAADAVLYVIDAREPVLGKYQDELAILAYCARPVLPVLNFVASGAHRVDEWRRALARVGLHTVAEFDTVVFSLEAELRLWDRLRGLLDAHETVLRSLIEERRGDAGWRARAAAGMAASFLLDAAACRRSVAIDNQASQSLEREKLQTLIGEREQACVVELLALYRFAEGDFENRKLALEEGPWRIDPFDPEALKTLGLLTGTSTGAGAAAGAAFDIMTGGLSLGAGTLVGTALGAGIGGWRSFGNQIRRRLAGYQALVVSDAALHALLLRQQHLLVSLAGRGHAAQTPVVAADPGKEKPARLPAPLRRARLYPKWSRLNADGREEVSAGRKAALDALVHELLEPRNRG